MSDDDRLIVYHLSLHTWYITTEHACPWEQYLRVCLHCKGWVLFYHSFLSLELQAQVGDRDRVSLHMVTIGFISYIPSSHRQKGRQRGQRQTEKDRDRKRERQTNSITSLSYSHSYSHSYFSLFRFRVLFQPMFLSSIIFIVACHGNQYIQIK